MSSTYTTPITTSADDGAQFNVVVSNSAGSATSTAATLTVNSVSSGCVTTSGTWVNSPLSQMATGSFRVTFDATPSAAAIDGVTGLSYGPASAYTNLAAIVRFNDAGNIDAMDSTAYTAVAAIPYLAGITYHFIIDVDTVAHTYSAYVMIGSVQTTIGSNLAFRSEQATTSFLNNVGAISSIASHTVCNAALSTASVIAPAITTQPTSQAVTAGQTATFTVAATGTSPMTYQWMKNGAAISGATSSSYTTPATTTSDNAAQFTVMANNSAGSATSTAATLTVNSVSSACVTSSGTWVNSPLSQTATGSFRVTFDATASAAAIDGVTGLSYGPASAYTSLAAIVRFNDAGNIDAMNSTAYTAVATIPYSAGITYHFIMDVNTVAHTYSAYVMIGSVQTTIGSNLAFRAEQATTSSLNNVGAMSSIASKLFAMRRYQRHP